MGRDNLLAVLHERNIEDKHHTLLIVGGTAIKHHTMRFTVNTTGINAPVVVNIGPDAGSQKATDSSGLDVPVEVYSEIILEVTFAQFGEHPGFPVVDCLGWTLSAVRGVYFDMPGEFR